MAYKGLIYKKLEDGVVLVTLNRPHRLNAISRDIQREFHQVMDEVEGSDDLKVLVITGAPRPDGRPCFSAGGDLMEEAEEVEAQEHPERERLARIARYVWDGDYENGVAAVCSRLERLSKPTIAAIDGVCTAGGLELALSCDIRVVSETAEISDLHIKNLGNIGGSGVTVRLARTVGAAWAKEIMFAGKPIDVQRAVTIGLASHVFPPARFLEEAIALAHSFTLMRPSALAMAKALINNASGLDATRGLLSDSYIASSALGSEGGAWNARRK